MSNQDMQNTSGLLNQKHISSANLVRRVLTLTDHAKRNWVSRLYFSVSKVLTTQSLFAAITRVEPLCHNTIPNSVSKSFCVR